RPQGSRVENSPAATLIPVSCFFRCRSRLSASVRRERRGYSDHAPKRFPIHRANKPNFAGNAAPRTAKIGNTPWVNICKRKVAFHETLPGVVPDSKLSTWSRFIEKYTKAQVPTVRNTKTQLNKTRRLSAGNG